MTTQYIVIFEVKTVERVEDGMIYTPIIERNTLCVNKEDLYDIVIKNKIELEMRMKKIEQSLIQIKKKRR